MSNKFPPKKVVENIWDFVDQFICPINLIPKDDERNPPGDYHGTGWFIEKNNEPQLCTCEHVARDQANGTVGYAPTGGDSGVSAGSRFDLYSHPVDFAIANISRTWGLISHSGKFIPRSLFDQKHQPVSKEYLYLQGFPGSDSQPLFEQHNVKGLGAFLHEVEPPKEILSEKPPFQYNYHICMAWNPANATPLTEVSGSLSVPGGLSGSVLWNTRYKEVFQQGRQWSINDMRITGIVWGASSKAGVVTATRIEHILEYLV